MNLRRNRFLYLRTSWIVVVFFRTNIRILCSTNDEIINLYNLVNSVIGAFSDEINQIDFNIQNLIAKDLNLYSVKGFLYSIFYNLISNAIKYRKKNTELVQTQNTKIYGKYKTHRFSMQCLRSQLIHTYTWKTSKIQSKNVCLLWWVFRKYVETPTEREEHLNLTSTQIVNDGKQLLELETKRYPLQTILPNKNMINFKHHLKRRGSVK